MSQTRPNTNARVINMSNVARMILLLDQFVGMYQIFAKDKDFEDWKENDWKN